MKTKKIRIPVAIHKNGEWATNRWPGNDDKAAIEFAIEGIEGVNEGDIAKAGSYHVVMVEAEVPIPSQIQETVKGQTDDLAVVFYDSDLNKADGFFNQIIGQKFGLDEDEIIIDRGLGEGVSIFSPKYGWFRAWEERFERLSKSSQ